LDFLFCEPIEAESIRIETRSDGEDWKVNAEVDIDLDIEAGQIVSYSELTAGADELEAPVLAPGVELVIQVKGHDDIQTTSILWPDDFNDGWATAGSVSVDPCG
jgi:hypothetical protein